MKNDPPVPPRRPPHSARRGRARGGTDPARRLAVGGRWREPTRGQQGVGGFVGARQPASKRDRQRHEQHLRQQRPHPARRTRQPRHTSQHESRRASRHKDFFSHQRPRPTTDHQHPASNCHRSGVVVFLLPEPMTLLATTNGPPNTANFAGARARSRRGNAGSIPGAAASPRGSRTPESLCSAWASKASLEDSALRGLDSGLAAAGEATVGRLGAAAMWDEFDQETSESELATVPSCHGSVPNRYAAKAPCSAITIAIRNNSLAHFSRGAPGHFSRALKASA